MCLKSAKHRNTDNRFSALYASECIKSEAKTSHFKLSDGSKRKAEMISQNFMVTDPTVIRKCHKPF